MPSLGVLSRGAVTAALVLSLSSPAVAQVVPDLPLHAFPPVSSEPIGRALDAVRAKPGDAAATGALAMLLHAWEQWDSAAEVYARARTLERRFEWSYLGGIVAARLGRHAEAATLFEDAAAIDRDSLTARLKHADALLESGSADGAARAYEALARMTVAEPHARYGLGRVSAARGDHAAAVAEFDAAVRLFPQFGAAWYSRGLSLRRLGRVDEARESLERAQQHGTLWPGVDDPALARVRALRDDASARLARGLALDREGDLAGATREHEAAVAADPDLAQAHVNLVTLYGRQREWAKAEAHYRETLRLGSGLAEAHYTYGVLLQMQDREAEAAAVLEQAVQANPLHAGAWNNLGQIAERSGRIEDAMSHYRRAVDGAPTDPTPRFNLGRMLLAARRPKEAIPHFEHLAALDSAEQPRYVYGLATACVLSGDLTRGRQLAADARALAASRGQQDLVAAIDRDLARLP